MVFKFSNFLNSNCLLGLILFVLRKLVPTLCLLKCICLFLKIFNALLQLFNFVFVSGPLNSFTLFEFVMFGVCYVFFVSQYLILFLKLSHASF